MWTKVGLVIILILAIIAVVYYFNNKNKVKATFSCADSKTMKVVFNTGKNGTVDITLSDGRKMNLPVTASAGGARYANKSESVVFWNVGNTARLEENNKETFAGCVEE
jgi:membrane-bound inhibitor of C-type lysozyme